MIITTIQVRPETRKLLQLRKQERNFKNVDEAIIEALQLSGSRAVSGKGFKPTIIKSNKKTQ